LKTKRRIFSGPVLIGLGFLVTTVGFSEVAEAQSARTNAAVNLREGPGTNYSVITAIPSGAYVRILGCTASYEWCGVDYTGIQGYSAGRYLTVTSGQYSGQLITGVGVGIALSVPLWRYNYWRPPHYHRPPGYRPPGYRPPGHRPPGAKPPGRPPVAKPPIQRPPGARPPRPTQPIARPPGNRPPGMRPPGNKPGKPGKRPAQRPAGKRR